MSTPYKTPLERKADQAEARARLAVSRAEARNRHATAARATSNRALAEAVRLRRKARTADLYAAAADEKAARYTRAAVQARQAAVDDIAKCRAEAAQYMAIVNSYIEGTIDNLTSP